MSETITRGPWPRPAPRRFEGRFVELRPLDPVADAAGLYRAAHEPPAAQALWRYLLDGPYADADAFAAALAASAARGDKLTFTVCARNGGARIGMVSLMNVEPAMGRAELGSLWYAPAAQRGRANTETTYLLLGHLFDELGYRRAEWKCDSRNAASRAAATRMGFRYEGLFRQHMVVKGENRDTAWFALLDHDWPRRRAHFERWLYGPRGASLRALNGDCAE